MTKARKILWIAITAVILFGCLRLYFRLTDDFRIANMTYEIPFNPEWETPPLVQQEREKLDNLLQQPFYYLGKGAQSYAFLSADKKYVLKFFKFKHLKPGFFVQQLPDITPFKNYKTKNIARKNRLLKSVFNGYKLAFDKLRNESGLIYIHLNKGGDFNQSITLYDKIGRKHQLDPNEHTFIIQRTVAITRDVIKNALEKEDIALAKERIDQLIELFLFEYKKGIHDRDHGFMHNTGFLLDEMKPIHLDVGKLSSEPNMTQEQFFKEDLRKILLRYDEWLKNNYPQYRKELIEHVDLLRN